MKNGLVLGLDHAGKTLLIRNLLSLTSTIHTNVLDRILRTTSRLKLASSSKDQQAASEKEFLRARDYYTNQQNGGVIAPKLQPTIGVENTFLTVESGRTCSISEVGGQMLSMWKAYFESCQFWIYVVDISAPTKVAQAAIELFNIMGDDAMRRKPKLIVLNKMDAPCSVSDQLLRSYLRLEEILSEPTGTSSVVKVSALTGENLDAVLKWLGMRASGERSGSGRSSQLVVLSSRQELRIHPVLE